MCNNNSKYEDDISIANSDYLLRRIFQDFWKIDDDNQDRTRPSSQAFNDPSNGSPMSVFIENIILDAGRSVFEVLSGYPSNGLAKFTAGVAREVDLGIKKDPLPDEDSHAEVFGNKTRSVKNHLARNSEWVLPLPLD